MVRLILLLLVLALWGCSSPGGVSSISGSGTGTGNPIITGVALASDNTPLYNGVIEIYPIDEDTSTFYGPEFNYENRIYTDSMGNYSFSLLREGEFCIEIWSNEDERAVSFPFCVSSGDTSVSIDTLSVLPLDTCKGIVELYGQSNTEFAQSDSVSIQLLGKGTHFTVKAGESFSIPHPKGMIELKISPFDSSFATVVIADPCTDSSNKTIRLLSQNPNSSSYTTDSLLVRSILDSNGLYKTKVESVSSRSVISGRIFQLTLTDSSINMIPSSIETLNMLSSLTISGTSVTELPAEMGNLPFLLTLNISNNRLTKLPVELLNLKALCLLDVSVNYLLDVSEKLVPWLFLLDPDWFLTQNSPESTTKTLM